jgi:UDP-N-acetylmuramate dehydrogenase
MLEIQENVDIKNYSTLKAGGQFRYFVIISSVEELKSTYSFIRSDVKYKNIPLFILGGGSNVVFSEGVLDIIALKIEIKGFSIINDTDMYKDIKIGAGENWDLSVEKTVKMNLTGLESLSLIPGTVGASPVQNIGAYGSEVKDTILNVEVFNIKSGVVSIFSNEDCKFGYRDSVFKNEAKGKYIITAVTFRLNKSIPPIPKYPGVAKYFEHRDILNPTLIQIRDAIIYIRNEKLPNPKLLPNVGSFFKNPIVPIKIADNIKIDFPDAKFFLIDDYYIKIPAGWLIENSGLKGKSFGEVSVYDKNALVLVNKGRATYQDIINARNKIIKIVKDKFGIELEQEPEII